MMLTTCLHFILLLVPLSQGLPTSRDHELSLQDTLLYVALIPSATSINVSWAVGPHADHTGEYKVSWVDQHNHQRNTFVADILETVIDGLKPCTQYTVSIARVHKTGQITTDSVEKATTTAKEAPPAVTGILSRDITERSLALSWERPATACELTTYRITYEGVAKWAPYNKHTTIKEIKRGTADNAIAYRVEDLQPYSDYTVMIVAYTGEGKGRPANLTITTEQDVPENPVNLRAMKSSSVSITVTWDQPAVINGVLGSYYVSWYRDGRRAGHDQESLTTFTIVGLSPCVEYTIHVAASTAAGVGDYKNITQTTGVAAPPATAGISCHSNEDQSVTMTWTKPDTACPIRGYRVSRPRSSSNNGRPESVDVPPTVLSANFSTQTGTNFSACVTAAVSELLIGPQACCDQDTLKVMLPTHQEHNYFQFATYSLIGFICLLLVAFLVYLAMKTKPNQQDVRTRNTGDRRKDDRAVSLHETLTSSGDKSLAISKYNCQDSEPQSHRNVTRDGQLSTSVSLDLNRVRSCIHAWLLGGDEVRCLRHSPNVALGFQVALLPQVLLTGPSGATLVAQCPGPNHDPINVHPS